MLHRELRWLFEDSRTRGAASLMESEVERHVRGSGNGRKGVSERDRIENPCLGNEWPMPLCCGRC